jgi:hypothetical protein
MSRLRTSKDDIRTAAEQMLRSSLSRTPSSTASTTPTLPGYTSLPQSQTNGSTPLTATTSRTRERLRLAELERDELRRAVKKAKAKAVAMRRLAEEESPSPSD